MKKLFSIGHVAREEKCSDSLIRIYERDGIVTPFRDSTGRRLFTEEDIIKIRKHREKIGGRR